MHAAYLWCTNRVLYRNIFNSDNMKLSIKISSRHEKWERAEAEVIHIDHNFFYKIQKMDVRVKKFDWVIMNLGNI